MNYLLWPIRQTKSHNDILFLFCVVLGQSDLKRTAVLWANLCKYYLYMEIYVMGIIVIIYNLNRTIQEKKAKILDNKTLEGIYQSKKSAALYYIKEM